MYSSHRWLNQDPERVGIYGNWDAYCTAALHPALWEIVEKEGNGEYARKWLYEFVPVVKRMQRRGFGHVHEPTRKAHETRIEKEIWELDNAMMKHVKLFDELRNDIVQYIANSTTEIAGTSICKEAQVRDWVAQNPSRRKPDARMRKVQEWVEKAQQRQLKTIERMREEVGDRRESFFNMTDDLKHVVFGELGLRPAPKTHKRPANSLSQDALIYILDHLRECDRHARPFLDDLFHRSRLRTIRDRYLQLWPDSEGRIYPSIKCYGTETLRLAYAKPALHQWPRPKPNYPTIRDIIRPRTGYVFVGRDYSQIEAKIFAIETQDQPLLDLFAKGVRIHGINAQQLFGITPEEWATYDETTITDKEGFAKSFFYGVIQYGGEAESVSSPLFCPCPRCGDDAARVNLSRKEKREAQDRWMSEHPAVPVWREKIVNETIANGYVYRSRFGFNRRFLNRGPAFQRELWNFGMQHGAAGVINDAMVRLDEKGAPLVLQMHDELLLECKEGADARAWDDTLGEEMERPVPEYGGYSFTTKGHIADNWGALK